MYRKQPPDYSATESAINLLSRRDHGTYELTQKLTIKGYPESDIQQAILYCQEKRYLDDLRYAKGQVRQHIAKGHGEIRIKQDLSQKRLEEHDINKALEEEKADWFELAKKTAEKKFKAKPAQDQKEYAKQVRFLLYRGFSFEQINYALAVEEN